MDLGATLFLYFLEDGNKLKMGHVVGLCGQTTCIEFTSENYIGVINHDKEYAGLEPV